VARPGIGLTNPPAINDQAAGFGGKLSPAWPAAVKYLSDVSDCIHQRVIGLIRGTPGQMPIAIRYCVRKKVLDPSAEP
jgi:hypothetical protein